MQQPDFTEIDRAAKQSAESDHSPQRKPTDAQKEKGNYKLGIVDYQGFKIGIENPRGSYRTGVDPNGNRWKQRLSDHYGKFLGTKGADGDAVDVFLGAWPNTTRAYVINQFINGAFDEHKCMLGYPGIATAKNAYMLSYQQNWKGLHSIIEVTYEQLKWWLKNGDMSRPLDKKHLPFAGQETMNIKPVWLNDSLQNSTIDRLLYDLRRNNDGLMLDSVTLQDIYEDSDGIVSFDALIIPFNVLERRMKVFERVLKHAGTNLQVSSFQVSEPFKQRGTVNVAVVFELSDGQTISVYFHNPDVDPRKLMPTDELVSYLWRLNKKDITVTVAPEQGKDLVLQTVAKRIMALAEKNSAAFARTNSKKAERTQRIEGLKTEIAELETQLTDAQKRLEVARIEAEDRPEVTEPNAKENNYPPMEPSEHSVFLEESPFVINGFEEEEHRDWFTEAMTRALEKVKSLNLPSVFDKDIERFEKSIGSLGLNFQVVQDNGDMLWFQVGKKLKQDAPEPEDREFSLYVEVIARISQTATITGTDVVGLALNENQETTGTDEQSSTTETTPPEETAGTEGTQPVENQYQFDNATEEFKDWAYSNEQVLSTAMRMDEAAKANGASIEWGFFNGFSLDSAQEMQENYAHNEIVHKKSENLDMTGLDSALVTHSEATDTKTLEIVEEPETIALDSAEKTGENDPEKTGDSDKEIGDSEDETNCDSANNPKYQVQSVKLAKSFFDLLKGRIKQADYDKVKESFSLLSESAINKIEGIVKSKGLSVSPSAFYAMDSIAAMDSVVDDENSDPYVGKIIRHGEFVGRVDMGEDGKAMVYVGPSGDQRVEYEGREAYYSDDDAALFVDWLFEQTGGTVEPEVPGTETVDPDPVDANESKEPSVYTIGKSKKNTVKFVKIGGGYEMTFVDGGTGIVKGGSLEWLIEFLAQTIVVGGTSIENAIAKLKHVSGDDILKSYLADHPAETAVEEPKEYRLSDALESIKFLKNFMSKSQLSAIGSVLRGEEKEYFIKKVIDLEKQIKAMPKTYDTDGQGNNAVAHLHYFRGGSDWYITERDMEDEQLQAFGYAILNGDDQNAEMGYISIQELIDHNVELDLYWDPKSIASIKGVDADEPFVDEEETDVADPVEEEQPAETVEEATEADTTEIDAEIESLRSETDIATFDKRLDDLAAKVEAAGLMEEYEPKLNEVADVLTYLLAEAEKAA